MDYEKPLLIDFALDNTAEGISNCKRGVSAANKCSFGSGVGGGIQCRNGSSAMQCRSGASAAKRCRTGSSAGSQGKGKVKDKKGWF